MNALKPLITNTVIEVRRPYCASFQVAKTAFILDIFAFGMGISIIW